MATATLPRDSGTESPLVPSGPSQRLVVTWQHPDSRDVSPVGLLSFDGTTYVFEYLKTATQVDGFPLLLGFPDVERTYRSEDLFPLFAQRAMDPRRPDFQRYVEDLGLSEDATPWEQLSRSGGTRQGDTLQLFPAPRYGPSGWVCYILVHGMRYLLEKSVVVNGEDHEKYEADEFERIISELRVGEALVVEHETTNRVSSHALIATTTSHLPLGWIPDWFAGEVFDLQAQSALEFFVDRVNPAEAGWHMRLVAKMQADCPADHKFFAGPRWETF